MFLLLAFASESDKTKFETLYHRYRKLLLYKAYEILKDYRLAEDAASEAWIRIFKNLHKIGAEDSNQTISFLVTIVKNTSLTLLSKEKRNTTELYDEEQQDQRNMEEAVVSQLSADQIYAVVNRLSEDLKSVFLLKYAHELSNKEIGKMLAMKENLVAVKLHRAKKKLAEILVQEGYADEVS